MTSVDHTPQGDPCRKCGRPFVRHRVEHRSVGDPCRACGLPYLSHRSTRARAYLDRKQEARRGRQQFRVNYPREAGPTHYLGIDGEGQGRVDHKYVFLACSDREGNFKVSVEDPDGLKTERCLDFILGLGGRNRKVFAYAFGYDLTKILTDVDNETLYKLFRPELRQRPRAEAMKGPYYLNWEGYRLNYQGSKFTVAQGHRRTVVWDVFKFFQSKFVGAIRDWKVGSPELWARMQRMKEKRHEFDRVPFAQVREYCYEECACMAELAEKLTDAHAAVGLRLKSYYGAGSSAGAMLNVMGIRQVIKRDQPEGVQRAAASAFFGGRFENSVVGPVRGPLYNYDISSAYPYQLCFLPCLQHGVWELSRVRERLSDPEVRAAVVRYELGGSTSGAAVAQGTGRPCWGPFPFRTDDGAICFPVRSGGGWVYREEYLVGERLFPGVRFREAWIYRCDCDCRPFARIPAFYRERVRIGKEGPGIVLKLGCNSCYGKLAQSVGNAVFNSWLWAGMITSGTRAQLLELLGLHADWSDVLMVATDGLCTRQRLDCPKPRDTGTGDIQKPLGGWEEKVVPRGMFLARPGIYFPLEPTEDELKEIRGRGIGKSVVLENWRKIQAAWPVRDLSETVTVSNVSRFCGAKTCVHRSGRPGDFLYKRANGGLDATGSAPSYGQWITRTVDMSFHPMPKRAGVASDGRSLLVRSLPTGVESTPYDRCRVDTEAVQLRAAEIEVSEQPDADWSEYL